MYVLHMATQCIYHFDAQYKMLNKAEQQNSSIIKAQITPSKTTTFGVWSGRNSLKQDHSIMRCDD